MLSQEHLLEIAERVIKATAQENLSNPDSEMVHLDYEILDIGTATWQEGRRGAFFKYTVVYECEVLDSNDLDPDESVGMQKMKRTIRLDKDGRLSAYSEPVLLD